MAREEVLGTTTPRDARIGTPEVELRPAVDHGLRERHELLRVEPAQGTRQHEHRELHLRIAALHHVREDGVEIAAREPRPAELAPHPLQALRGTRVGGAHGAALGQPEVSEGVLGEPDLVHGEQRIGAEVEHPGDLALRAALRIAADDPHAVQGLEAQRALLHRALVDHHDVLVVGVDSDPAQGEHRSPLRRGAARAAS
jgi:hypothetical protein